MLTELGGVSHHASAVVVHLFLWVGPPLLNCHKIVGLNFHISCISCPCNSCISTPSSHSATRPGWDSGILGKQNMCKVRKKDSRQRPSRFRCNTCGFESHRAPILQMPGRTRLRSRTQTTTGSSAPWCPCTGAFNSQYWLKECSLRTEASFAPNRAGWFPASSPNALHLSWI